MERHCDKSRKKCCISCKLFVTIINSYIALIIKCCQFYGVRITFLMFTYFKSNLIVYIEVKKNVKSYKHFTFLNKIHFFVGSLTCTQRTHPLVTANGFLIILYYVGEIVEPHSFSE